MNFIELSFQSSNHAMPTKTSKTLSTDSASPPIYFAVAPPLSPAADRRSKSGLRAGSWLLRRGGTGVHFSCGLELI